MSNTSTKRPGLIKPTEQEDAAINRGIAEDPDTYELSDEQFKKLRPWPELKAELDAKRKR